MKRIIWLILIIGIGGSVYLLLSTNPTRKDVSKEIATLPTFNLLLTDSQTIISTGEIKMNKATVFFYFDPNCEHCQVETEDLMANKDVLKRVNFYFISLDSMHAIKKYMEYYHLDDFPEIIVAKDYEFSSLNIFKIKSIPSNIVYNNKKKIVAIFEGGMKLAKLKEVLNI